MLKAAAKPLTSDYDVVALDLDGVIYRGADAVPGAAGALAAVRERGTRLAFITNNAARTPASVAEHLGGLGVNTTADDVVSSAQAAATLLAERLPANSAVYVIGGEGLEAALSDRGLRPVRDPGADPVAVVQGFGPQMPWIQVVNGALLVAQGLPWVATNMDLTFPTARGLGPGNGTLVNLVATYAGREPEVAGKPARPLFDEMLRRVGASRPLFVGDSLATDVSGANEVGWDVLLVLSGVTDLHRLVRAPAGGRPTYLGLDVRALNTGHPEARRQGACWVVGGYVAGVEEGRLQVRGDGEPADWWRAAATAAWEHLDDTGSPVDLGDLEGPR